MLLLISDLCLLLCIGCAAWALAPHTEGWIDAASRPILKLPGIIVEQRSPFLAFLRKLGHATTPRNEWSEELGAAPAYPGSQLTVEELRGMKLFVSMAGLGLSVLLCLQLRRVDPLMVVCVGAMGFIAPDLWVRSRIQKRNQQILRLLPEVIDLLALCVGAGVDFLGGINRILGVEQYRGQPLVDELALTMQEMKFGKRKGEAFRSMARRVKLPEVSSFVQAIVMAERMGTPIADVLAVHSEDVRFQRFNRAERAALKAPMKILFPLVFCIMPCVAIIVGTPVFLQFERVNPFAEGGAARVDTTVPQQ